MDFLKWPEQNVRVIFSEIRMKTNKEKILNSKIREVAEDGSIVCG